MTQDAGAILAEGKSQVERREYDAAIASFDRGAALQPQNGEFLFWRAIAKLRKGDHEGSVQDNTELLRTHPQYVNAIYNRGYSRAQLGKHAEALGDFELFLQRQPDDPEALLRRGLCRLQLQQPRAATADFDRILQLKPNDVDALFHRGRAWQNQSQWEKAIADYNQAFQLNPKYDNAWFNRAWCKGKLGDHRGAVEDYDRYIEVYPKDIDSYIFRGNRRLDLGDYPRAMEDYEKAISLDAKLEKDLKPWVEKAAYLRRMLAEGITREFAAACCERGWAKIDGGELASAVQWFNRAIDAEREHADAWRGRGRARCDLGLYQEAIQDGTRAIELNPQSAAAWSDRGLAKRMSGDTNGGIADYDKAIELKPDLALAWWRRAYARSAIKDFEGAIQDYTKYLEFDEKYADAWLNRGHARDKLGRYQDAIADFSRAIDLNPKEALAYSNRGYSRRSIGDKEGAAADFRKAMELREDWRDEMQKALAEMQTREESLATLADQALAAAKPGRSLQPPPPPVRPIYRPGPVRTGRPLGCFLIILIGAVVGLFFGLRSVHHNWKTRSFKPYLSEYAKPGAPLEAGAPDSYISGKVVTIDISDQTVDWVYFDLPDEIRATGPEEVGTVVQLKWGSEVVGHYSNGGSAVVQTCQMKVIDRATWKIVADRSFRGSSPPQTIKSRGGWTSEKPTDAVVEALKRMPRR